MPAECRPLLGVIGAGEVVARVHLPVLLAAGRVEVAWVADASPSAVRRARRMFGVPAHVVGSPGELDALAPVDHALLTIPVGARGAYHEHLAARGVSVYAEKPVATSGADLRRLEELFPDGRLRCGMQRRFYANIRLIAEAVRDEWFGPLRTVRVAEGARTAATGVDRSFRDDRALSGGGILIELGTHALDVIHMLAPGRAEVSERRLILDAGLDRDVSLRLQLGDVRAAVELSWLRSLGTTLRADFEHCSLVTSTAPSAEVDLLDARGAVRSTLRAAEGAATLPAAVAAAWDAFLDPSEAQSLSLGTVAPTVELIERVYAAGATA